MAAPEPLLSVVSQHAEECIHLRHVRSVMLRSAATSLRNLLRWDNRIAAHLDGLSVAGATGEALLTAAVTALPECGAVFAATVNALQSRHADALTRLVALADTAPHAERGFLSALGWVSAEDLQGTVRALLGSKTPTHRAWGLAACAMHRVDPGVILQQAIHDANPVVQARAWHAAGQLGRRDLADAAREALTASIPSTAALSSRKPHDDDEVTVPFGTTAPHLDAAHDPQAVRRAAAWALTLWGMGGHELVRQVLIKPLPDQSLPLVDAHRLAIVAAPIDWGRDQVRALAAQAESSPIHKRRMLRLAGWIGDPQIVPWLIHHMADDRWARLAGEAFSLITGADLDVLDLYRPQPEAVEAGPSEDPADEDVAIDEDEGLFWPDPAKVQAWWQGHAGRLTSGQRHLAGETPSPAHAMHLLHTGGQRQRVIAAEYLCLLRPGDTLFPVAAPAWRQRRWLSAMTV